MMFKHAPIKTLAATAMLVIAGSSAQAQLLGGAGGGLTGSLGGGLGGTLGTVRGAGNVTGTLDSATRIDRSIDTRSGRVEAGGRSDSSAGGSLTGDSDLLGNSVNGHAQGSGSASAGGNAGATLIGTDAVRDTAGRAVGTARGTVGSAVGTARGAAGAAVGSVRDQASGAVQASGAATGSLTGSVNSQGGSLASDASGAATGSGSLFAEPGMPILGADGDTIGYVQSLRHSASGTADTLIVESGDEFFAVPATQFSGSGDVLLSGMTRGELRKADKATETSAAD